MSDHRAYNSTLRVVSLKRRAKVLKTDSAPAKPRTPIRRVNPDRAKRAYLRDFGEQHGAFVRSRPCLIATDAPPERRTECERNPGAGPTEACHAKSRGAGGDKTDLFPGCGRHHDEFDGRRPLPDGTVGPRAFVAFYGVDPAGVAVRLWAESPENPENVRRKVGAEVSNG